MKIALAVTFTSLVASLSGCALDASDPEAISEIRSASESQCPANAVCAWSGANYTGGFSWWPANDTGCKAHAQIPTVRSGKNNTGYWVRFGGQVTLPPATSFASGYSVAGQICWPV